MRYWNLLWTIEFDLTPITVELNSYCACAIGIYLGLLEFDLAPITVELNSYCACAIGIYALGPSNSIWHRSQSNSIPTAHALLEFTLDKRILILVHSVLTTRHTIPCLCN